MATITARIPCNHYSHSPPPPMNKQAIQDKYCIRGAEWGVGDCSAEGMTPQDRDEFIAMLKKKAGVE
ncbi:hypothetical protein Tco_1010091 [Tanacetum coccineum]